MNEFQTSFHDERGMEFFGRGWEPAKGTKAAVALVHGLGEHTGRYSHVGEAFAKAGYALMGFDLRGHGESSGIRGHSPDYEALMEDLQEFLGQVGARYRDLPLFLYGHSMGGNLVINYVLRRKPELRGVIATGPWLKLAFDVSPARYGMARFMSRLFPSLTQASGLEQDALSREPQVIDDYAVDPLVHDRISVRQFVGIHDSGVWALEHADELRLPLLLMHGTDDRIVSEPASREFAERGGDRVTFRAWEGLYHEIHNEPERKEVLATMISWMDERLG